MQLGSSGNGGNIDRELTLDADTRQNAHWVIWLVAMLCALAFLVWAGSATGDRWNWTIYSWTDGAEWAQLPQLVPGTLWLWLAAATTFTVLSLGLWLLTHTAPKPTNTTTWLTGAVVLLVAAAVRWLMLKHWTAGGTPPTPQVWALAFDLTATILLLVALARQGQSLLWATTYAWHPLVTAHMGLGNLTSLGATILLAIALLCDWPNRRILFLQNSRSLKGLVLALTALAATVLAQKFGPTDASDGFLLYVVRKAWALEDLAPARWLHFVWAFAALTILLQSALVAWGVYRHWSATRILGHALVIASLCWPNFHFAWLIWALALSALSWNRAVWVMSGLAMALWARHAGLPTPDWLMLLIGVPVAVVEIQQLLTQELASRTLRQPQTTAQPVPA